MLPIARGPAVAMSEKAHGSVIVWFKIVRGSAVALFNAARAAAIDNLLSASNTA